MTPDRPLRPPRYVIALALAGGIAALALLGEPRPLGVVAVTPPDGADAVPTTTQLMVTFSRPVDAAGLRAALSLEPPTEGFLSVAGRRAAFTPRTGLRADTDYTLTLAPGLRDQTGGALGQPAVIRFRTRGPRLVAKTAGGRLVQTTLDGTAEELTGPDVGAFAVSAQGSLAYVEPATGTLVVRPARCPGRAPHRAPPDGGPVPGIRIGHGRPGAGADLGARGPGARVPRGRPATARACSTSSGSTRRRRRRGLSARPPISARPARRPCPGPSRPRSPRSCTAGTRSPSPRTGEAPSSATGRGTSSSWASTDSRGGASAPSWPSATSRRRATWSRSSTRARTEIPGRGRSWPTSRPAACAPCPTRSGTVTRPASLIARIAWPSRRGRGRPATTRTRSR